MKRIALLSLSCLCLVLSLEAKASANTVYLGLGAGIGTFKSPDQDAFGGAGVTAKHSKGGLSGRAFVGYRYTDYLALELGYARYARTLYEGTLDGETSSIDFHSHAIDLVAKAILPWGHTGFSLYALAGAARVAVTEHYKDNGVPLNGQIVQPSDGNTHYYATRPIYGAGIEYDFNQTISMNVEATQIRHNGNFQSNNSATPDMDLFTANLAYHFG